MPDILVLGISGLLIVKYVVNAAKAMGMSSKFALPLAVVLGVALAVANQLGVTYPVFKTYFEVGVTGLLMGLGAAEFFDATKRASATLDLRQAEWELKTA